MYGNSSQFPRLTYSKRNVNIMIQWNQLFISTKDDADDDDDYYYYLCSC